MSSIFFFQKNFFILWNLNENRLFKYLKEAFNPSEKIVRMGKRPIIIDFEVS